LTKELWIIARVFILFSINYVCAPNCRQTVDSASLSPGDRDKKNCGIVVIVLFIVLWNLGVCWAKSPFGFSNSQRNKAFSK